MKTRKKESSSGREDADYYRRKAEDADRAAETAGTAEAKQFYQETAKNYYLMADSAHSDSVEVGRDTLQTTHLPPVKPKSRWSSFFALFGSTPEIKK
jgi:hypothetical protein